MKNSVLVTLMLIMVLGFGINAFARNSEKSQMQEILETLIPTGYIGYMAFGSTSGGRGCEVSINSFRSDIDLGIIKKGMWGLELYSLQLTRLDLQNFSDNGSQIKIEGYNRASNATEIWIISTVESRDGRVIKGIELLQEKTGWLGGKKMKSVLNCQP